MYRIILFLLLVALAAMGAAWVADQPGEVVFPWAGGLAHVTLLEFAVGFGSAVVAAVIVWSILHGLWRLPEKVRKGRRDVGHRQRPSGRACVNASRDETSRAGANASCSATGAGTS